MSPPPLAAPIARRLSISASAVGEEGLFSCVLPEELVVEIIADRVQVGPQCDYRGILLLSLCFQTVLIAALEASKRQV